MMKQTLPLILAMVPFFGKAQKEAIQPFDSNFAHVVYFWFKNPEDQAARKLFETSLATFLVNSKYAKTNFIGTPPKAVRAVVDDTFTYNLVVTFASADAQAAYQDEEAHLTFVEECKHLWDKVVVYDAKGIAP
ncbi:MAG: Dabb family protein [Bacteroidota bacterium]